MRSRRVLCVVAALVLLAGCGRVEPDRPSGQRRSSPATPPAQTAQPSGRLVKVATAALSTKRLRLEMLGIERRPEESVLRFTLTNLEKGLASFDFPTSAASTGNFDFKLIDPVGHKGYTPLYDERDDSVGSDPSVRSAEPGVTYDAELHFPPIPEGVKTLTVLTPSTAGEFTGVPVIDAGAASTGAGTTTLPVRTPQGEVGGGVYDLFGIVEDPVKVTTTSGKEQQIGLRTDVLFDFDSAKLSDKAAQVLDGVAAETKAKADPAKPPIRIEGHTDGKGTGDYNIRLSRQRAQTVLEELRTRLSAEYRYEAEGKGETEPVAEEGGADDEQARQKNRRVEVSYQIRQRTPGTATASGGQHEQVGGAEGRPAAFRPSDGGTVADRTVEWKDPLGNRQARRMDVKPFYRDGDYLVAVFEITNLAGSLAHVDDYGNFGRFEEFTVLDPATNLRYMRVRIGPENWGDARLNLMAVDPSWAVFNTDEGTVNRGFFYVPAPPPGVKAVTFDAGRFGRFANVPIAE
ncbi:OmpA family protein [Nonomuraea sp. NPDC046802]|uniref:OmpA family protein n=1 Tax=Nonomuraea sp. NPDC046802 TaxID=3154919 RepID=UPI0033EFBF8F